MNARRLGHLAVVSCLAALVAGCAVGEWALDSALRMRVAMGGELAPEEIADIPAPQDLRPCCAFGTGLQVKIGSMVLPGYEIENVVAADDIGQHNYDQGPLLHGADQRGVFQSEKNGLLYTCRGGFIDTAHVRDNADRTLYLAAQIGRRRVSGGTISFPAEGGERHVVLQPLPWRLLRKLGDRETVVRIAEWTAFQLSVWHEIATWYGWSSTSLFPETASAFSPEDLYSNLLGIRIAGDLIRQRRVGSELDYNKNMDLATRAALERLGPLAPEYSLRALQLVDQVWWNSKAVLPEKRVVLRRNLDLEDPLEPWRLERYANTPELQRLRRELCDQAQPLRLSLPDMIGGVRIGELARLEIVAAPTLAAAGFPFPDRAPAPVTPEDFPPIIAAIRDQNRREVGAGKDEP